MPRYSDDAADRIDQTITAGRYLALLSLVAACAAPAVTTAFARSVLKPARAHAAEPGQDTGYAQVDAYLRNRMEATKAPGLVYAIVTPDSIEHIGAWGHDGDGHPVTSATPFLWGSVSKPVTATAVMTLVEAGAISLDEPVRTYLPSFSLADEELATEVTVRHLLEQTSGIPDGTGVTDQFDRRPDPYGGAVADLADVAPLFSPGERHEYSSANYLVLGAVVEAASGQTFTEYLHDHILDPLEMTGTITTPDEADAALPDGHRYVFGRPVSVAASYDQTGPSYGYLGGTVKDLAHFAMAQLNGGRYGSTQVLDASTTELMQTGTAHINDTHSYGLGWRDDTRNADLGTRTIWHGGAVQGYQAMVLLLPDMDRGVVVLQNIYGFFQDSGLAAVGLGATRLLAGGQPAAASSDGTYAIVLTGLVAVCAALAVAIGWPIRRLFRRAAYPGSQSRTVIEMACWTLGGLALAYLAGIQLPKMVGATLRLIPLWAPDVGWLLIAISVGSIALAITRLTIGFIRLGRFSLHTPPPDSSARGRSLKSVKCRTSSRRLP